MPPNVLYDACVLYPAPLRSLLMYLALTGVFRARWSNDIHDEWMRNVVQNRPDITRSQLERVRDLMNRHVPDGVVTGYEPLIPTLQLPDPNDRHVLAAAIQSGATTIVTSNTKDFPQATLAEHSITAVPPDAFVVGLLHNHAEQVLSAVRQQRSSLKNPPLSPDEYLASLSRQGLNQTVSELSRMAELI